jgi:hypothetical protein
MTIRTSAVVNAPKKENLYLRSRRERAIGCAQDRAHALSHGTSIELGTHGSTVNTRERHMRGSLRIVLVGGLLVQVLFALTAAVSPDRPEPPVTAVALAQPVVVPVAAWQSKPILHESGLLILVGGGLLGLSVLVRKTTKI